MCWESPTINSAVIVPAQYPASSGGYTSTGYRNPRRFYDIDRPRDLSANFFFPRHRISRFHPNTTFRHDILHYRVKKISRNSTLRLTKVSPAPYLRAVEVLLVWERLAVSVLTVIMSVSFLCSTITGRSGLGFLATCGRLSRRDEVQI